MAIDKELVLAHQEDLEKLHDQRRMWLWASSGVFWAIILIIFAWDWISGFNSKSVWWVLVSAMLLVSINWWYWTMRVIRKLIHHQEVEYEILKSILLDIAEVKSDVRDLKIKTLDKSK